jgi:hypothetical protein
MVAEVALGLIFSKFILPSASNLYSTIVSNTFTKISLLEVCDSPNHATAYDIFGLYVRASSVTRRLFDS